MKIAVDFDGVICKREGIPTSKADWYPNGEVEGALASIEYLISLGHDVWIFTSNPDPEKVKKWLWKNGFPALKVSRQKTPSHMYIDDRAVRFTNWQDIRKYFG